MSWSGKEDGKDQESIQSGTTTDPKQDKVTKDITNNSQEVKSFLAGDHKAAMNRRESMTNTRHKYYK